MEVNRMIDGIRATNMELVDVLTAISQVSMRLAVKLEMLERAELKKKIKEGDRADEAVRSQPVYRRSYCDARTRPGNW